MINPTWSEGIIPFTPDTPVAPRHFVGQESQLNELRQIWTQHECSTPVLIHGGKRMGKTSLLNKAADLLLEQTTFVILDCAPLAIIPEETDIARHVLSELIGELSRKVWFTSSQVSDIDNVDTLYTTLRDMGRQLQERANRQRHVLVFDNYQLLCPHIANWRFRLNPLEILYQITRLHPNLGFAVVGSWPIFDTVSCIRNIEPDMRLLQVRPLSPADVRTFFGNLLPDLLLYFETETSDKIFLETGGHPYLIHKIGCLLMRKFYAERDQGNARPYFTAQDVEVVLRQEFDELQQRLLQGSGQGPRRSILTFLAWNVDSESDPISNVVTFETIQANFSQSPEATRDTLDQLERLGFIVNPEENAWRIAYTSWIEWIQEWT